MPELRDVHECERDARELSAMLVDWRHRPEVEPVTALASTLNTARAVPEAQLPESVVKMGSTVTYVDGSNGKRQTVTVVHPAQADAGSGRVSVLSPIGRALLGHPAGSSTDVRSPIGRRLSFRIKNIARKRTRNAEAQAAQAERPGNPAWLEALSGGAGNVEMWQSRSAHRSEARAGGGLTSTC